MQADGATTERKWGAGIFRDFALSRGRFRGVIGDEAKEEHRGNIFKTIEHLWRVVSWREQD